MWTVQVDSLFGDTEKRDRSLTVAIQGISEDVCRFVQCIRKVAIIRSCSAHESIYRPNMRTENFENVIEEASESQVTGSWINL